MANFPNQKTLQFYVSQALHRACNKRNKEGLMGEMEKYFASVLNDPAEWKQLMKTLIDKGTPNAAPIKEDGSTAPGIQQVTFVYKTYGDNAKPPQIAGAGMERQLALPSGSSGPSGGQDASGDTRTDAGGV